MRYPGGIISATAPTVNTTSAKGVWTLEQVAQYVKAGTWPSPPIPSDPDFEYVTTLLSGTGTNGAQNNLFLDSSSNALTVSSYGNATQGTFSPFSQGNGYWGMYTGSSVSSGNKLSIANGTSAVDLAGETVFTVEGWFFPTAFGAGGSYLVARYAPSSQSQYSFGFYGGNWEIGFRVGGSYGSFGTSVAQPSLNTWHHFAVVRNGSAWYLYLDGSQIASRSNSGTIDSVTAACVIGGLGTGTYDGYDQPGYISNLRFLKGTALYTGSTYTVPTSPLTAITNTTLLICQSNRFIDNSGGNVTISTVGTPAIQQFSPFNPTAAWSSSTNGGSGYFDGAGDYLAIADNNVFDLGTSSYTMEFWVYPTSLTLDVPFAYQWDNSGGTRLVVFVQNNTGTYSVYYNDGSYSFTSSNSVTLNAWNHIAFVRNGNTFTFYINGVSGYSASNSISYPASNLPVYIGASHNAGSFAYPYYGYISNVRVVIGTAIYTTTFTPPTAPVSNVAGTQLLCSFTNAGVYDAAAKNNFETAGNAQISSVTAKFGSTSIKFDGTGDYLLAPNSPNFIFNTGDFTVEAWVYPTNGAYQTIVCLGRYSSNAGVLRIQDNNTVRWYFNDNSVGVTTTNTVTPSSWNHVCACRSGTTTRVFINGVQGGSFTDTSNYNSTYSTVIAGEDQGSSPVNLLTGYLQDVRITKGFARYTSNFVPPTTAFALF